MITLLGSLLGFGTSFLPEVLNFFRAGQEHKHSLERMKLEMDMMARRNELKLDILDKQAEIKETEGLYKHDSMDAGAFINALRGSVRPVITYVFFGLFVAIKVTATIALMGQGYDLGRSSFFDLGRCHVWFVCRHNIILVRWPRCIKVHE